MRYNWIKSCNKTPDNKIQLLELFILNEEIQLFFYSYSNIIAGATSYPQQLFIGSSVFLLKSAVTQPTVTYGSNYASSSVSLAFDTARSIVNSNPTISAWSKGLIGMHANVGG